MSHKSRSLRCNSRPHDRLTETLVLWTFIRACVWTSDSLEDMQIGREGAFISELALGWLNGKDRSQQSINCHVDILDSSSFTTHSMYQIYCTAQYPSHWTAAFSRQLTRSSSCYIRQTFLIYCRTRLKQEQNSRGTGPTISNPFFWKTRNCLQEFTESCQYFLPGRSNKLIAV
jgi:hypothetical protein